MYGCYILPLKNMAFICLIVSMRVGRGLYFSEVVATSMWAGPLINVNDTMREVSLIPYLRIWGYVCMLSTFHVPSRIVVNTSESSLLLSQ